MENFHFLPMEYSLGWDCRLERESDLAVVKPTGKFVGARIEAVIESGSREWRLPIQDIINSQGKLETQIGWVVSPKSL